MLKFSEVPVQNFENYTILLDIDGTLTPDGLTNLNPDIIETIQKLKNKNRVFLCSNKKDHQRNKKIATLTRTTYLNTPFKKPNPKILDALPQKSEKLLVIGDKFLTDERFSRRINAEFIKVRRVTSPKDSFFTRLSFIIDDVCAKFFGNHK